MENYGQDHEVLSLGYSINQFLKANQSNLEEVCSRFVTPIFNHLIPLPSF